MSYLTFSSVFQCLYNGADHKINPCNKNVKCSQSEFFNAMFYSYTNGNDQTFDNSYVGKFSRNERSLPNELYKFYVGDIGVLTDDISEYIIPWLIEYYDTADMLYKLINADEYFDDETKADICSTFPFEKKSDVIAFITKTVYHTMSRPKEPATLPIPKKADSFIVEYDLDTDYAPPPLCRYFCGRDDDLIAFSNLIDSKHRVFITGIAGIGKSEFAKAYAKRYRDKYKHILFFTYNGDLRDMIEQIPIDDTDMSKAFSNRHKLLRRLGKDTLIIIDNFNVRESELYSSAEYEAIKKYKCDMIFTTRSKFDSECTYELGEISADILHKLVIEIYPEAEECSDLVDEMISIVHRHTYAVEITARLMKTGLLEPDEIFEKLKTCSINPELADKVKTVKDDKPQNQTYYSHIRFLFNLFDLNDDMRYILSCTSFVANEGMKVRPFAKLCALSDLNTVHELDESGLLKLSENGIISMHPMVRDIVFTDLEPSIESCNAFIKNVYDVCSAHGIAVPVKSFADMLLEICRNIRYGNVSDYLLLLEEAFGYYEPCGLLYHMEKVNEIYTSAVNALPEKEEKYIAKMYYIQCACVGIAHGNYSKAIPIAEKGLELSDSVSLEFKANMHHNLGYLYYHCKRYKECKTELEKAVRIYQELEISTNDTLQTLALLHDVNNKLNRKTESKV